MIFPASLKIVNRNRLTAIMFFFIIQPMISQVNDAGLWENIYLDKKIAPKWMLHLNEQGRVDQNITRFHYVYGDFGITYKWNKHIHIMCDYVLIEKRRLNDLWSTLHQAYVALVLKQKIASFTISNRIMAQVQYSDIYSSKFGMIPDYKLRNKTMLKYNNNSRYTYYIALEIYYKINNTYYKSDYPQGNRLDRIRYFVGAFYELNKRSSIELYYLYENNFNSNNPPKNFVIGIGYSHSF
jgi:hypothetical protein